MNREDVIRLVRENGFGLIDDDIDDDLIDYFERFAALVADIAATEEREACAQIAEDEWTKYTALEEMHHRLSSLPFNPNNFDIDMSIALRSKHIADLIRDRGTNDGIDD